MDTKYVVRFVDQYATWYYRKSDGASFMDGLLSTSNRSEAGLFDHARALAIMRDHQWRYPKHHCTIVRHKEAPNGPDR